MKSKSTLYADGPFIKSYMIILSHLIIITDAFMCELHVNVAAGGGGAHL